MAASNGRLRPTLWGYEPSRDLSLYYRVVYYLVADTRWIDFVYTRAFERSIEGVLDDHSMRRIELDLVRDPKVGGVERGTGGVRKIRIALPGTGKRGGLRLLYVLDEPEQRIYFLLAWPKGVKASLSSKERQRIAKLVRELKS